MKTFTVVVEQTVHVTLDETKFDEAFMEEFQGSFFPYFDLEDHAKHLAQLEARGITEGGENFIEGYGPAAKMGISMEVVDQSEEVIDVEDVEGRGDV